MVISGAPGYHQVTGMSLPTISTNSRESQNGSGGEGSYACMTCVFVEKKKEAVSPSQMFINKSEEHILLGPEDH